MTTPELLALARYHERVGLPLPVDLECRLAAEGVALNPINDTEDTEDHG